MAAASALVSTLLSGRNILAIIAFGLLAVFSWPYWRRPRNAPPGPLGLPLLGSILSFGKHPGQYLRSLTQTYGTVISLYIGSEFVVVLNDVESAKHAFLKYGDIVSGRDVSGIVQDGAECFFNRKNKLYFGLIGTNGAIWKTHRKFSLNALRDFGMGKASMEEKIKEEIGALLPELRSYEGRAFDNRFY
ncbi:PREDICTED: cytochrome P450 2C14-like [Priapulus caudatus]|uniref:Cytochrome P450 2C14-like n=1 Tax=Priapulus caudatus TaxID=37621 RepID=A0ABM1EQI7_PRICU|nr:PREDICTED: cytochrome P450 2C14-like [Priapulus caudatus]